MTAWKFETLLGR